MDKLAELKQYVAQLFDAATDKTVIEKSAVVSQKIDELEQERTKLQADYQKLLGDYKDVVLHTSFKPKDGQGGFGGAPETFDPDAAFKKFFIDASGDK